MTRSPASGAHPHPTRSKPLDIRCAPARLAHMPSRRARPQSAGRERTEAWAPAGSYWCHSGSHAQRGGVGSGGQAHDERGPHARDIVMAGDLASVLFEDSVADAEAEPGAFSDFLGGKKRVENPVGMGDALTVIRE